jgi:hypothetical protein
MSEDKIVASNLAAAILVARPDQFHGKNPAEVAAKLYFDCCEALITEAKNRPTSAAQPLFGSYGQ